MSDNLEVSAYDMQNDIWAVMVEPNEEYFIDKDTGLPCRLKKNSFETWCGYVGVDSAHPLYNKYDNVFDYHDMDVEVHGGVTYANREKDYLLWIGFDCNHFDDYSPYMAKLDAEIYKHVENLKDEIATYKTIHFARKETIKLAKQLKEWNSG